jgi:hypothetical protein
LGDRIEVASGHPLADDGFFGENKGLKRGQRVGMLVRVVKIKHVKDSADFWARLVLISVGQGTLFLRQLISTGAQVVVKFVCNAKVHFGRMWGGLLVILLQN